MTAIIESIVADIETTVAAIATGSGYDITMQDVTRYESEGTFPSGLPGAVVTWGPMRPLQEAAGYQEWAAEVIVDAYTVHNPDEDARSSDALGIELAANIQKAMMQDRQRDGNAINTTLGRVDPFPVDEEGGRIINVAVAFEIIFRHRVADPGVAN